MTRHITARVLHDGGLAAWFGGSLVGAIGINGAANDVAEPRDRARVASAGWARWAPWNAAAIGAHLIGGALLTKANSGRIKGQAGVAQWTATKTVVTAAALGATAYSGALGVKVQRAGSVHAEGGTKPSDVTPPETAKAMQQLRVTQWVVPALTGALVAASAVMGEQQRPSEVLKGATRRAGHTAHHFATHPDHAKKVLTAASKRVRP